MFTSKPVEAVPWPCGSPLPNGATVIEASREHVLARYNDEYVTWGFDPRTGDTFWGHYFADLLLAVLDFNERVLEA